MIELKKGQPVVAVGTSGALSSGKVPPYDQIPLAFYNAAARRLREGNLPKDGRKPYPIGNWHKGVSDFLFVRDRANHAFKHFVKLLNGIEDAEDDTQGNIDALVWFAMMIAEAYDKHPEVVKAAFYSECRDEIFEEPK